MDPTGMPAVLTLSIVPTFLAGRETERERGEWEGGEREKERRGGGGREREREERREGGERGGGEERGGGRGRGWGKREGGGRERPLMICPLHSTPSYFQKAFEEAPVQG